MKAALLDREFPETGYDTMKMIRATAPGLPAKRLEMLAVRLGLSSEALAILCGFSKSTWHRTKTKAIIGDRADRLLRIGILLRHATDVFESEEEAVMWLKMPAFGLAGAVPIEFAATAVGFKEVDTLLTRIDYGVYV